jgi:hypothetical protein
VIDKRERPGWYRSIVLKDSTTLAMLADVRIVHPSGARPYPRAKFVAACRGMMMAAAESGHTEDATKQIELALFLEARYLPVLGRWRSHSE